MQDPDPDLEAPGDMTAAITVITLGTSDVNSLHLDSSNTGQ